MSALPRLCFGNSFIIPVASQRETWIYLFYFEKVIELKCIKSPGVLEWAFVEYKVLATHDLLSWPWLLSPSLHLETGSAF